MASIQSLGVGSGLLTSELVEDIIAAEREATDLRLDAKKAEFEAKISAYGAIRSSLDAVITASGQLGDSDSFLLNTISSTNEGAVTATADATATPGIHTVEVLASARAHSLTSIRFDSADEVIGDGTLDIRFGTTTFAGGAYDTFTENPERAAQQIVIDSSNNTLTGIRDAINAAGVGVEASVVDDGEGFVLVLTSAQTGEDHSMEITVTEGTTPGLSAFNFNATDNTPGTHFTQSVDADDAVVTIDGITVTRETNVVEDVISGVTFNVVGTNAGAPATVTVSQDTSGIAERMQGFVDAYNDLKGLTDTLTEFDTDEGVGSLLTGDATVRNMLAQMRRFLFASVDHVQSGSVRALVDLGITTNQDAGFVLQFSSTKFQQAISANPNDVVAMLADQTRASDSQISVIGFQSDTVAGSYDVDITTAAARAEITGATVAGLAGPITIDDDNDELSVTVDGYSSGAITLTQGVYADGAALALQIQTQINQDTALRDAGATVEVSYDSDNQALVLSSSSFGVSSTMGIDSIDTDTLAELGLTTVAAADNTGVDVAGTINGISGVGAGQFLSIPSGPVGATSGRYAGTSVTTFDALPLTIDASNDTFRLSVDGILSSDITLNHGSYASASEVATELASQINADTNLTNAGLGVSVTWDAANQRFNIQSDSEGQGSSVNLTYANAGVVSDLGLNVAVGTPGANASAVADPAAGLQLRVQGTSMGERGTVTLVRGVMNQMEAFLKQFVGLSGTLSTRLNSLDEQVGDVEEEAADFGKRMDLLEERLRIQFAAADALISTLNNTSSFLDRQLASLPGYTNDN